MYFRPLPALSIACALLFAFLIGLGVWQLQRLHWKLDLIAAVNRNMAAAPITLDQALAMGPALRRSMAAMLEAASVPSDGLGGALRQNGLLAIHYAVSRVYDRDDTADLSKTMAALDSRLKMAERWAQFFDKYTKSLKSPEPAPSENSPAP